MVCVFRVFIVMGCWIKWVGGLYRVLWFGIVFFFVFCYISLVWGVRNVGRLVSF